MPRFIRQFLQAWGTYARARRRQANLRAGARVRPPARPVSAVGVAASGAVGVVIGAGAGEQDCHHHDRRRADAAHVAGRATWTVALVLSLAAGGAAMIAGHARHLGAASPAATLHASQQARAVDAYRNVLPGAAFTVQDGPGATTSLHAAGALLVVAGMQGAPAVRVDLCGQLRGPGDTRLLPLRLGDRFDEVRQRVALAPNAAALRNVLLVSDSGVGPDAMPQVQIDGMARADFADPLGEPLRVLWRSRQGQARWLSDASLGQVEQGASGQVALRQQGWLLWGTASALRIERRASVLCPQAGELVVQLYRRPLPARDGGAGPAPATAPVNALVTAFPAHGRAVRAYMAPGQYQVPAGAAPALEDQALFAALQHRGMVRRDADGAIELAPRDLPQWLAAPPASRAADLRGWQHIASGPDTDKLFKRLYAQADGAYVRQQIDIFNGERRLLAWRVAVTPSAAPIPWTATLADQGGEGNAPVMLATSGQMPLAAARLFASLPQGWQPWTRVARWPQGNGGAAQGRSPVTLRWSLPQAAAGGETVRLLVAGRVDADGVIGAAVRLAAACTGRACRRADDVQEVALTLTAGARQVALTVRPLDFSAPDDAQYRHVRVVDGRLAWQPLANVDPHGGALRADARPVSPVSPVRLADRHGAVLWDDGAPTRAAVDAGLAPLLGMGPEHASSVAGMLARLPSGGAAVNAGLTLDLPLQALSQRILACVGMRHGRWDGSACAGGQAAPDARRAGLVIIDTDTGDILAAAGAGAGEVNAVNWAEARDYDRTNPARSPLRLPALQHDGGAHQSPGSTFKVISAMGLEMAATSDPQLGALLDGMPLAAINRLAQQRGYGFQTGAASYPLDPRQARITNYREQGLDRRAQEGKLGLAQALTYSLNTWFAWTGELSDRTLFGRAAGGAPGVQALDADALDAVRPIVAAAHLLGFEQPVRLDGGLLPADFNWRAWDALQATAAHIDPIQTRHELRQMAIGLRMQVTPLHMALASAAIGQGRLVAPRLLLSLDGRDSPAAAMPPTGVRLDRIRAGMKGVVDAGTGAGAFAGPALASVRPGLYGKTGTAPTGDDTATVWFTGWLEPNTLPGQRHRLAMAAFVSHSDSTGGGHAAPVVAAVLSTLAGQRGQALQAAQQKPKLARK